MGVEAPRLVCRAFLCIGARGQRPPCLYYTSLLLQPPYFSYATPAEGAPSSCGANYTQIRSIRQTI